MNDKINKYLEFIVGYGKDKKEIDELASVGLLNGEEIAILSECLINYYLETIPNYLSDRAQLIKQKDCIDTLSMKHSFYSTQPYIPIEIRTIIIDSLLMAVTDFEEYHEGLEHEVLNTTGLSLTGDFKSANIAYLIQSAIKLKLLKGSKQKLAKVIGVILGNSGSNLKEKLSEESVLKKKKDFDVYINTLKDLIKIAEMDRINADD